MKKSSIIAIIATAAFLLGATTAEARPRQDMKLSFDRVQGVAPRANLRTGKVEEVKAPTLRRTRRGAWAARPFTNGKKANLAQLDFMKCLKSNVLRHVTPGADRSNPDSTTNSSAARKRARATRKTPERARRGKQTPTRRLHVREQIIRHSPHMSAGSYGTKKGKLSQMNITMIIKSGAMARPNTIQQHKSRPSVGLQRRIPTVRSFRRGPNHRRVLNIKFRDKVGGRCFGHNCR